MKIMLDSVFVGAFGLGGTEILIIFMLLILGLIPMILYLLTLQNTLNEISAENRQLPSGQVWLTLIPLFGMVWQFIIVNKIADSLKGEFAKRNILIEENRPGASIGITYFILNCCTIVPFLGVVAAIACLVCWIIYWTRINAYKIKLQQTTSPYVN